MRKALTTALVTGLVLIVSATVAGAQGSGGVTGAAFYVDGTLYRTVNTPTDLSGTNAPESSFDTIYDFGGLQPNVATAAPGDPGFKGGRWMVHAITFEEGDYAAALEAFDTNDSGDLDSDEEVEAAIDADLAIDNGVVKQFECPVIPLN